jgi:hypothetical protein
MLTATRAPVTLHHAVLVAKRPGAYDYGLAAFALHGPSGFISSIMIAGK